MNGRAFILPLLLSANLILLPAIARPQGNSGGRLAKPHAKDGHEWIVSGRVSTVRDEPIFGAKVRVDFGAGPILVNEVKTNLSGEFECLLDPNSQTTLKVKLVASKDGYLNSLETLDLTPGSNTERIDLVLREDKEDSNQLPLTTLVSSLSTKLRASDPEASVAERDPNESPGVAQEFLDKRHTDAAQPLLARAVELEPNCVRCRTLFALALLEAGSWSSATRQLTQAATLNSVVEAKRRIAEPLILLGVLECWRGRPQKARDNFLQALEMDPTNPLALQELGRTYVLEQNWDLAAEVLAKAVQGGESPEAHLLYAQTLLAQAKPAKADFQMRAFLGGRKPGQLSAGPRRLWSQMMTRLALESEGLGSKSDVDLPIEKLVDDLPELKGLEPAQSQDDLALILQKVGEGVATFFSNFPNTSSREEIRQESLHSDGKVRTSLSQDYQYLLLSRPDPSGQGFEEYRTGLQGGRAAPGGLEGGLMLTSGFASASLPFHPLYQAESRFRYLGRQPMDGHDTQVLAYAQRPESARVVGAFNVDQASAWTLTQGVAWADSASYQIIRMRTDLLAPIKKYRLDRETTEIHYGEFRFKDSPSPLWLPRRAAVTVKWRGKILRNQHTYSDFKLFNVGIRQKPKGIMLPPEEAEDP